MTPIVKVDILELECIHQLTGDFLMRFNSPLSSLAGCRGAKSMSSVAAARFYKKISDYII